MPTNLPPKKGPDMATAKAKKADAQEAFEERVDRYVDEAARDMNDDEFKKAHAGAMAIVDSVRRRASARKKA